MKNKQVKMIGLLNDLTMSIRLQQQVIAMITYRGYKGKEREELESKITEHQEREEFVRQQILELV